MNFKVVLTQIQIGTAGFKVRAESSSHIVYVHDGMMVDFGPTSYSLPVGWFSEMSDMEWCRGDVF